jgi:hypothetical protein
MNCMRASLIFAAVIAGAVHLTNRLDAFGADSSLQPLITTSELVVGPNRFALRSCADILLRIFMYFSENGIPRAPPKYVLFSSVLVGCEPRGR